MDFRLDARRNVHQPSYNVTVRHLRAFVMLAEFRSFTRAANVLRTSQPSLTMSIQQLEDIVGCSLFDRTTRQVVLTPEGVDFLPVAERVVADFDLAVDNIRVAASARKGRIAIAVVHSVSTRIVPRILEPLLEHHPKLHVQLLDGNSGEVRRRVKRNEVDLGFASKDEDDSDLIFRPLFRDQVGLLARNDHPLVRRRRPLQWADLAEFDFVGLTAETATGRLIKQTANLPPNIASPRFEVSTNAALWALLESGIGITIAPALSVQNGRHQTLRFCPLAEPVAWRRVFVITRTGRTIGPVTQEVIRRVREEVTRIAAEDARVEVETEVSV